MLTAHAIVDGTLRTLDDPLKAASEQRAVWFDLLHPTPEEERAMEAALGVDLPTREEMQEIEESNRLYQDDGGIYMTATILQHSTTDAPGTTPVTFVLAGGHLVTLRYAEPRSFPAYIQRAQRGAVVCGSPEVVMLGLLDTVSDRLADLLERLAQEIDGVSRDVFAEGKTGGASRNYRDVLRHLGRTADALSKARETLISMTRLLTFFSAAGEGARSDGTRNGKESRGHAKTLIRDLQSLSNHADFLSGKIAFLLDAILGLVNIEQSGIIKIFSVAAVAFLPPTLVASIYGMNFEVMPELSWPWGYPMALGIMLLSAVLPCLYFKWRGWL